MTSHAKIILWVKSQKRNARNRGNIPSLIHVRVCICKCVYIRMWECACDCVWMCVCVHDLMYVNTNVRECMRVCVHASKCITECEMHVSVRMYESLCWRAWMRVVCLRVSSHLCMCVYVYMRVWERMHWCVLHVVHGTLIRAENAIV